eukprot:TRINITY_DN8287_c0_g1_i1.p1 TRINITY_DN8287_c0_g1~~TRINITY_DN8287_c0_g1_i1.p1  ORF type:complete len:635 (-),score=101.12 TRINITY_DN8287_c0_g1_i1:30-1934(-)
MRGFRGGGHFDLESPQKNASFRDLAVLAGLWRYLWPPGASWGIKIRFISAIACLIVVKIVTVTVPWTYKMAVDSLSGVHYYNVTETRDYVVVKPSFPWVAILGYGILRLLSSAGSDIRSTIFYRVQLEAQRIASLETFDHLHKLSMAFHTHRKTGSILRALERGSSAITFLLNYLLFNIVPTLLELLFVCIIMVSLYKIWFTMIILASIVVYVAFSLIITEWRTKFRREMNAIDNKANNIATDSLINIETVKYFGNAPHEYRRYDEALTEYIKVSLTSQYSLAFLNIGQSFIICFGVVSMMLLAGRYASHDPPSMTVGDFVLVNTYMLQLYIPLNFLGASYRMIKSSLVDLENMFSLLNEEIDIKDIPGASSLIVKRGHVQFNDVVFSYGEHTILNKISFEVPAGHMVAIVGHTGAGKSTLSRMLFRFYDIQSGLITIDDQDITRVKLKSLRKNIGVVPQDTVLFNDTIEYNIRYGRISATREQIEEVAKLAHIHDFIISLPNGYDTMVGERGLRLSGGEKQRVSIARALLKDPKIMIFDEATSSLDTKTEKEIQSSLQLASKGRTTLVIAHRLSTIIDAQQILVLKAGEIIERGTHEQLLAQGGEYSEMWMQQLQKQNQDVKEDQNNKPLIEI